MYINTLHFKEIDSTHSHATADWDGWNVAEWTAISADTQHLGRGQRTKTWQDVPGKALLCTLVSPQVMWPGESLMHRHMAMAVALCEAIEATGVGSIGLKWPNDLYLEGRNVGGILTEAQWTGSHCTRYAGSLGLNIEAAPPGFAALGPFEAPQVWRDRLLPPWVDALMHPDESAIQSFSQRLVHRGIGLWRVPGEEEPREAKCLGVDAQGRIGLQWTWVDGQTVVRWYVHGETHWVGGLEK